MTMRRSSRAIEEEIEGLATLPRPDLVARWQRFYRRPPPKGSSQRFLILGIAYRMQAKRFGDLNAKTRRQLEKALNATANSSEQGIEVSPQAGPGSRLVREWNGRTHTVDVVVDGYIWNGERHRSLSAIARAITGARWSGPRFFGIDKAGAR